MVQVVKIVYSIRNCIAITVFVAMLYNLAIDDLSEVTDKLHNFSKAKWKALGRKLGLSEEVLDKVKADYKEEGVDECLVEMLKHWLRMNYKASDSKLPTWSNLADAVEKTGDPALAKTIREHYP